MLTPIVVVSEIPAIHTKTALLTSMVDLVNDLEYFAIITPRTLYIAILKNMIMTVAKSIGLEVIYLNQTLKSYTTAVPESWMTQAYCFKKHGILDSIGNKIIFIIFPYTPSRPMITNGSIWWLTARYY